MIEWFCLWREGAGVFGYLLFCVRLRFGAGTYAPSSEGSSWEWFCIEYLAVFGLDLLVPTVYPSELISLL